MESDDVLNRIDEAIKNPSIPRRVKVVLERVSSEIKNNGADMDISLTTAIYELDEIVNDVNISMQAKTVIWDLISILEALKGS